MPGPRLKVAEVMEATAGGTRRHLRDLALGLDKTRFDVHVVVSTTRDPRFAEDLALFGRSGVSVHAVAMTRAVRPADARAFVALFLLFRRERFDLVHAHSAKAGVLGRWAAWLAGTPVVVYSPHAFPFVGQDARPSVRFAYGLIERETAAVTHHLIAVSQGERKEALRAGVCASQKISVIYNGVDQTYWDEAVTMDEARRSLDLPADAAVIGTVGTVGRETRQKGLRYLVAAIPELVQRFPNLVAIVVGMGERRSYLRSLAATLGVADRILWLEPREDLRPVYASSDVYVLPSLWEGLPYTVLEAMACGKPVVATRVAGSEEAVVEGVTGRLVPPGNVNALGEAVAALLASPQQRERMGRAGRERVAECFTTEAMVEKMAALYERLAGGAS